MTDFTAVTHAIRRRIKAYLATHTHWDTATLRINAANEASAILDADKTFNGPETVRCYIGTVGQLLNDIRREG